MFIGLLDGCYIYPGGGLEMGNHKFLLDSLVVYSRVYIFLVFFYDAPANGVS
jgi:hypothetical protein